jgi:hypothetical protein
MNLDSTVSGKADEQGWTDALTTDGKQTAYDDNIHDPSAMTPGRIRAIHGMTDSDFLPAADAQHPPLQCLGQTGTGTQRAGIGVAGFLGDESIATDAVLAARVFLSKSLSQHSLLPVDAPSEGHGSVQGSSEHMHAGSSRQSNMEASMDICLSASTGVGVQQELWLTKGHSTDPKTNQPNNQPNEPFLKWLMTMASDTCPPPVFTVSYVDNEDSVTMPYFNRVNVELQKAGVRGISILFASGDVAQSGAWKPPCSEGEMKYGNEAGFPAGSPWVSARTIFCLCFNKSFTHVSTPLLP